MAARKGAAPKATRGAVDALRARSHRRADEGLREERHDQRAVRVDEDVVGPVSRAAAARDLGEHQRERAPRGHRDPDAGPPDDAGEGRSRERGDQGASPLAAEGARGGAAAAEPGETSMRSSARSTPASTAARPAARARAVASAPGAAGRVVALDALDVGLSRERRDEGCGSLGVLRARAEARPAAGMGSARAARSGGAGRSSRGPQSRPREA